jgi:hypothetical protein
MAGSLFDLVPDSEPLFDEEPQLADTGEKLAAEIIGSAEYRQSVKRRIQQDSLPPAVELYFLQKLFGKVPDTREVTVTDLDLKDMTDEQLVARAEEAVEKIRAARATVTNIKDFKPKSPK